MAWIFPLDLTSSTTDGGGGKLGRGTLTPQSTEDKTEDVSMSATYNEPNADTQLWFSTYSKSLIFSTFLLVGKSTIYIPSTYILGTIAGAEVVTPYQQLPSRYQNSNLHNMSHAIRHVTNVTGRHVSNIRSISHSPLAMLVFVKLKKRNLVSKLWLFKTSQQGPCPQHEPLQPPQRSCSPQRKGKTQTLFSPQGPGRSNISKKWVLIMLQRKLLYDQLFQKILGSLRKKGVLEI